MAVAEGTNRRSVLELVAQGGGTGVQLDTSDVMEDGDVIAQATKEKLEDISAGDLRLLLPVDTDVPRVMEALEAATQNSETGVQNWGIVEVTLEDVFWEPVCPHARPPRPMDTLPVVHEIRADAAARMRTRRTDPPH